MLQMIVYETIKRDVCGELRYEFASETAARADCEVGDRYAVWLNDGKRDKLLARYQRTAEGWLRLI